MSVQQRWAAHVTSARVPKHPIQFAIAKYGAQNFTVEVLVVGTRKYITSLEEPAIVAFNTRATGYNVANGGCGGNLGPAAYQKAKETRKKWTQTMRDRIASEARARRAGKTYDEIFGPERAADLRRELVEKQLAKGGYGPKKHSAATKEKISQRHLGREVSQITRQKMRVSATMNQAGKRFAGRRATCLCCKKEWDIGNFIQHIKRNTHEL